MLYPTVSNRWNIHHQSRVIADYTNAVSGLESEDYDCLLLAARVFNKKLAKRQGGFQKLTEALQKEYDSLLDPTETGIMGYIEIPKINCKLAIGHGTAEAVLQKSAGHLSGSSLPVGGKSTHCVISGHRGLPSASLFSNLDVLQTGDRFTLNTLGEVLTYEVDQILTVLPTQTEALQILKNQDLCTLITCTPYGVNSHRLLVRGHRIEAAEEVSEENETDQNEAAEDVRQADKNLLIPVEVALLVFMLIVCGYCFTNHSSN